MDETVGSRAGLLRRPLFLIAVTATMLAAILVARGYLAEPEAPNQYSTAAEDAPEIGLADEHQTDVQESPPETIAVYISGAVQRPGVYRLQEGARVGDAIALAGGPLAEADLVKVNLAARLQDEEQVNVPLAKRQDPEHPALETGTEAESGGKLNLNTATAQELEALPLIGPATAERIVEHRASNGPFKTVEDLTEIKGVGPATLEQIKDFVMVEP